MLRRRTSPERKRQQNAISNHKLRQRAKQSDQSHLYDLWLKDSEVRLLVKDLSLTPSDLKSDITKREWRRLIGDICADMVRKTLKRS
jgi:hypothetical protein